MTDLTGAAWRKSTRSGDNGGDCVEVATNLPDVVAVRDSKDPSGPSLRFTQPGWAAFLSTVKAQPHR
ncbi:DUF397 domain-containing protein [Micromonospora narathiwatensis]|uniref:DUF397 domain-containing protein n=1 Tax=Micromonospora narathiwatensis TaxID=299146 RepID=A0A1A8ZL33_9ACTN|nr:DUF397 domain-containing protein [Micromonospora narathiwatensis]SBT44604.1 protein of unknown function (DUF397) [Micromonospora narathiwatensis]